MEEEDLNIPTQDSPLAEALRKALEMTTPGKGGLPWEHPDHKKNKQKEPSGWL